MDFNGHTGLHGERSSGALVIFTRVEGLLREHMHAASAAACDPLRFLASHHVPLVLVSSWEASEIRRLQDEFAFRQPFICHEGAALHVPRPWLCASADADAGSGDETEWEVFRFSPPSISAAFERVCAMFVARGYDPLLTVGIGCDLADYALLAAVDIPIVVRDRSGRRPELLGHLPGVYITSAAGATGWSEVILGVPS
jgi:hypothetical protein